MSIDNLEPPPRAIEDFAPPWKNWLYYLWAYVTRQTVWNEPTSITLTAGTSSDALADLVTLNDGNEYKLEEVAATPGFDLAVNFTNIQKISGFVIKAYYDGIHYMEIQLYNYTTTSYDVFLTFDTGSGMNYRYIEIPDDEDYVDDDGNAVIRIYHPSGGSASDDAYIDYVSLFY